jgi:hypothetical protein
MGAANALAAYRLYAGKVPPLSLSVLVYMSLVALDKDEEPSWWEGHDMLALRCLGASEPVTDADRRSVRRAITKLFDAGAITVARHSSGHGPKVITARYRLWLTHPAPDEKRPVRSAGAGRKPSGAEAGVGRKVDKRRTKTVRLRRQEEDLKQERDLKAGIPTLVDGTRTGPRARGADEGGIFAEWHVASSAERAQSAFGATCDNQHRGEET